MSDSAGTMPRQVAPTSGETGPGLRTRFRAWRNRKVADPAFQAWAARHWLTRRRTRADGEAVFDLVAGFVQAQALFALVELDLLAELMDRPASAARLAERHRMAPERMAALLNAGVALGLLERAGSGYQTGRKGAAVVGVPGLSDMVRHHAVFYRDMADPLAVLRGEAETELAQFWPYVFGAAGPVDPAVAARYSELMAESQAMVAAETLAAVDLSKVRCLLDVGGGTGAFLTAVGQALPGPALMLFDLPGVAPGAQARFETAGLGPRSTIVPGNFRQDPLPQGADAISLVRVLYDHADTTVAALLDQVFQAAEPGGRCLFHLLLHGDAHGPGPKRGGDFRGPGRGGVRGYPRAPDASALCHQRGGSPSPRLVKMTLVAPWLSI